MIEIEKYIHLRRHQPTASAYRKARMAAFETWANVTSVALAA
jgi:hypothetical protein